MNLIELLRDADRKLDHGEITIGEYEKMIAPLKDAVPVRRGRWQWISSTYDRYDRVPCEKHYWCSKCHHETITHDSEPWEKFCPNCGARMDGKGDGNETD